MRSKTLCLCLISSLLSGCAYKVKPVSVAAYDIYSSHSEKLAGKYLLYVDASAFNRKVKPTGLSCAAHSYPVEGASSFKSATIKTITNIVDEIETVDTAVPASGLKERGAKGMIVVKAQDMVSRLRFIEGFFSATAEADFELVVSVLVDGQKGRLFGTTVSGTGRAESQAGMMCEGGSDAVSQSLSQAGKKALTELAESISNAERLRAGH